MSSFCLEILWYFERENMVQLSECSPDELDSTIDVLFQSWIYLTESFLPGILQQLRGWNFRSSRELAVHGYSTWSYPCSFWHRLVQRRLRSTNIALRFSRVLAMNNVSFTESEWFTRHWYLALTSPEPWKRLPVQQWITLRRSHLPWVPAATG